MSLSFLPSFFFVFLFLFLLFCLLLLLSLFCFSLLFSLPLFLLHFSSTLLRGYTVAQDHTVKNWIQSLAGFCKALKVQAFSDYAPHLLGAIAYSSICSISSMIRSLMCHRDKCGWYTKVPIISISAHVSPFWPLPRQPSGL